MHSYSTFVTHEASKTQTSINHNSRQSNSRLSRLNSAAVQAYVDVDQNTRLNSSAPARFCECLDNCFVVDANHDVRLAREVYKATDLDRVGDLISDQHAMHAVTHQALCLGDCRARHANRARSQLSQRQCRALVVFKMRSELSATLGEGGCHLLQIRFHCIHIQQ